MLSILTSTLGRNILIGLGAALIIGGLYWWGSTGWDKFRTLDRQAGVVLIALQNASDNPGLKWKDAAGQVVALGESNRDLKDSISEQNRRINDMAREAVRLKAHAAQLKQIADKAEAQRRSAVRRLNDLSITPGTREDCMTLLNEANEALDIVHQAATETEI